MDIWASDFKVSRLRRVLWYLLILSCLIGVVTVVRRMIALSQPPSNLPQLHDLDASFQAKAALTWIHISCGLLFVVLVPLQFVTRVRAHSPTIHRWIGRILVADGVVAGAIGIAMVFHYPIGGLNEVAAILVFGGLFIFSLLRGLWYIRHRNMTLHREWMIRAVAVALGIATVRPIMGVLFATSRLTHLTPRDFFGTAFWIGFTINLVAAEAWLNYTRARSRVQDSKSSRLPSLAAR